MRCNVDDCGITNTTSMPGEPTTHTHEILEDILLQLHEISQMSAGDDAAGSSNQFTIRKAVNSVQQSCNILVEKLERSNTCGWDYKVQRKVKPSQWIYAR